MGGIIDLDRFDTTPQIAAWALQYLMDQRGSHVHVKRRDNQTWFIGWGGRSVIRSGHGRNCTYQLKSFRRFEYRIFDNLRDQAIDFKAVAAQFRWLYLKQRKEIINEQDKS